MLVSFMLTLRSCGMVVLQPGSVETSQTRDLQSKAKSNWTLPSPISRTHPRYQLNFTQENVTILLDALKQSISSIALRTK